MKTKKLFASMLAASVVLAGCGNDNGGNGGNTEAADIVTEITEPVTISFWHGMSGVQQDILTQLTEEFMADNPNIKVELMNQGAYSDLQQKLTAAQASPSDLPTLTQAYPGWIYSAVQDGLLQELDSYISNETIGMTDYEDILPALRQAPVIDGVTYGMPFNKSTEVIWYNKTLFEELGLEVPTTLEELTEVSKKITEAKGIPGAGFDSLQNFYVTYLINQGIEFDEKLDPTCPESIAAANYYLDGIKGGYFRIAGSDKYMSGPFSNELVGMYVGSSAGESYVRQGSEGKFEYGVARYPDKISIQQGTDIYMFNTGTAEQKTAAFLYLKYLTSKESQITWAVNTGYMPIRQSAIESDEYKNSGSMMATVLADATSEMFVMKTQQGSNAAYTEANTVMEDILANPDSNVEEKMAAYKTTLETSIYE